MSGPPVKVRADQADALGGPVPCQLQPIKSDEPSDGPGRSGPPAKSVIVVDPSKADWIGIELVDTEKKPVGFLGFVVTLPNHQKVTGVLDQNGKARIEGIDPGTCRIEFPTVDRRDFV